MAKRKEKVVPVVERLINYQFQDPNKCWEALQGKGAGGFPEGNKRLAHLGDIALAHRLAQRWYPTGQRAEVCQSTIERLANNANLIILGKNLGLAACINPNPSQKGVVSDSLIADTMEALIGAVSYEGDMQALDRVMEKLGVLDSPAE